MGRWSGYTFHNSRHAWKQDRAREREARARGDELRRHTDGDVTEHPRLMLAELRRLLETRPARESSFRSMAARRRRRTVPS